jgi:hypothetical protein
VYWNFELLWMAVEEEVVCHEPSIEL